MLDQIRIAPGLSRTDIDAIVQDFLRTEFAEFEALRHAAVVEPMLGARLKRERDGLGPLRWRLGRCIDDGDYRMVEVAVGEYLEARGLNIDPKSAAAKELARALTPAWLGLVDAMDKGLARPESYAIDQHPHASTADLISQRKPAPALPHRAAASKTIGELIEPYIRERERSGIGKSFVTEIRTALSWFEQWFGGDTPVASLSAPDLRDYKDGLLQLPPNWSKKMRGVSIRDAASRNADGNLGHLEIQSLDGKRWKPAVDFLEWARANLHISENPAKDLTITVSKSHRSAKRRDEFELEDLQRIFNAPIFRGFKSEREWWSPGELSVRDDRFWIPLIALFTGGRRGELCQLHVEDVKRIDGILCIEIRERFDDEGEKLTSLKNKESSRLVPVHPELMKIGFEQFVETRRATGAKRLFDCPETNNFDQFGKWFSRFLDRIDVKTGRNAFHSFRHCMEQAMRENIEDFTARTRITGRANSHSSEGYGKGHSAKSLFREISKVQYPGLDLSHLYADDIVQFADGNAEKIGEPVAN